MLWEPGAGETADRWGDERFRWGQAMGSSSARPPKYNNKYLISILFNHPVYVEILPSEAIPPPSPQPRSPAFTSGSANRPPTLSLSLLLLPGPPLSLKPGRPTTHSRRPR